MTRKERPAPIILVNPTIEELLKCEASPGGYFMLDDLIRLYETLTEWPIRD